MSDFIRETIHPIKRVAERAEWLDDYYGKHQYGVRFPDGQVFHEDVVREAEEKERKRNDQTIL